jgi:nucleotide-binding universal stress UspA family protein
VVAHADVPVLVAIAPLPAAKEGGAEEGSGWPAVIGHDFSEHSDYALAYAAELLPALGARALLAHALPGFFEARDEGEAFGRLSPQLRADVERELEQRLAAASLEGEVAVLSGKAAGALSRLAIKSDAGLMIVASLGAGVSVAGVPLGGFAQVLIGSTATGCLRQSSTSVLVVREPDDEERARRKVSASTPTIAEKEWSFVR